MEWRSVALVRPMQEENHALFLYKQYHTHKAAMSTRTDLLFHPLTRGYRLARAIFEMQESFFESRQNQMELLGIVQYWAQKVLERNPLHREASDWSRRASARICRIKIALAEVQLKQYGVSPERRAALEKEIAQLHKERLLTLIDYYKYKADESS